MAKLTLRWAPHRPGPRWSAAAAVGGPGVVTLLALPEEHVSGVTAALLYVLAVALAAGIGGALAGVAASILSFFAVNFFFTPPLHTIVVNTLGDVVALI